MILWHLLSGAAPSFPAFFTPVGGVADLLRYGGLLCSGRPAGLLRTPGRFAPEHAVLGIFRGFWTNPSFSNLVIDYSG